MYNLFKSKRVLVAILLSACLAGCSTDATETEETASNSTTSDTVITESTTVISTTETTETVPTSEVTPTTETDEAPETTEHNPVHIIPEFELTDTLPDGEYYTGILEFDDDCSGATFVINGYYALPEEEVRNIQDGDIIKWGDQEETVSDSTFCYGDSYFIYHSLYCYTLQNQDNGYYYLRGDYDEIPFYRIADSYHLTFDPNVEIYDGVQALDLYSISLVSSYTLDEYLSYAYRYDSLERLRYDMETVRAQNYHYLAGEEYWVGIHTIIENGRVVKMYLNPSQHQNWIPDELLGELRDYEYTN